MSLLPWAPSSLLHVLMPLRIAVITPSSLQLIQKWVLISLLWVTLTQATRTWPLVLFCGKPGRFHYAPVNLHSCPKDPARPSLSQDQLRVEQAVVSGTLTCFRALLQVTHCIIEVLSNALSEANAPPVTPGCRQVLKKSEWPALQEIFVPEMALFLAPSVSPSMLPSSEWGWGHNAMGRAQIGLVSGEIEDTTSSPCSAP